MPNTEQFRLAFPGFRVFVFGLEVTEDVTSINVRYGDGNAPGQCQITLNNEFDKYVLTTQDMMAIKGISGSDINLPHLQNSQGHKNNFDVERINNLKRIISLVDSQITPESKKKVVLRKIAAGYQDLPESLRVDLFGQPMSQSKYRDWFKGPVSNYPVADGSCIFNAMDEARVFFRDPFNPDRWYHMFAGFLSDISDQWGANNDKSVTLLVEDVTKLLRYTRMFINPGIVDAKLVMQEADQGIRSFNQNIYKGMSLPEIIFTTMFGASRVGVAGSSHGLHADKRNSTGLRGVGHFSFDRSGIFKIGPEPVMVKGMSNQSASALLAATESTPAEPESGPVTRLLNIKQVVKVDSLAEWQAILDHEVLPRDPYLMATDDDRQGLAASNRLNRLKSTMQVDSNGELTIESVITYIGEHPEEYPVDGGRVLMLIPASLGERTNSLVMNEFIQTVPLTSENSIISAGKIMKDVVDIIEFCMYASPRGDIVVEPPLYDFDPNDFGYEVVTKVAISDSHGQTVIDTESKHGPFGANYVIEKRDTISLDSALVDEKVYTVAIAPPKILRNWDVGNMLQFGRANVTTAPDLIAIYGARDLPLTIRGFITTFDAASLYANLMLRKANADAHTARVTHLPNIHLWINRPIYVIARNLIGTVKQVGHSLTWGQSGDMTTTTDLHAIRRWDGSMRSDDPTIPQYNPIGGHSSTLLNWAVLLGRRPPPKSPKCFEEADLKKAEKEKKKEKTLPPLAPKIKV